MRSLVDHGVTRNLRLGHGMAKDREVWVLVYIHYFWTLNSLNILDKYFYHIIYQQKSKMRILFHYRSNDTFSIIELFHSLVLSLGDPNCSNNIWLFYQQFEWPRVNGDSNSHLQVLGMKHTVRWHFTGSDLNVTLSHAIVFLFILVCQLYYISHLLLHLYINHWDFHSISQYPVVQQCDYIY